MAEAVILGALLLLCFGLFAMPLPEEAKEDDLSEMLRSAGRIIWPIGLAMALCRRSWTALEAVLIN